MTLRRCAEILYGRPLFLLLSLPSNSILLRPRATSFIHSASSLISCKAADICVTMPASPSSAMLLPSSVPLSW